MSISELQSKLTCPRCGSPRVVTKVKKEGRDKIRILMKCPQVVYTMPAGLLPQAGPLLRERIFLCRKCGAPVEAYDTRRLGNWVIILIRCAHHGQGERRISASLYDAIMQTPAYAPLSVPAGPAAAPTQPAAVAQGPTPPVPPSPRAINFCPQCGKRITVPDARFCPNCGASLQ